MEYIVVAYRSRESTLKLYNILVKNGINCAVVNTPKEAGVGCGLSVKIDKGYFQTVKRAVSMLNLRGFAGFFLVKMLSNKRIVKSI